jgi:hypothetical protein
MLSWIELIIAGLAIWFCISVTATYCISVYFRHKREYIEFLEKGWHNRV